MINKQTEQKLVELSNKIILRIYTPGTEQYDVIRAILNKAYNNYPDIFRDNNKLTKAYNIISGNTNTSKIISLTASCVVRQNSLNDTIEVEFRQKSRPRQQVLVALQENGFVRSSKGDKYIYIAKRNDTNYQFAMSLCKNNEEPGRSKPVEEAETAKYAQDVEESRVNEILDRSFSSRKITLDNLSDDIKEALEGKTNKLQVVIPQVITPIIENETLDSAFQQIIDDIMAHHNVYLVGGAGTGKTTLAVKIAKALGREYRTINCSQWTSPMEIIGGQSLEGYVEGKMIEAWINGHMLILDELPKIDPNTAGLFNDALAKVNSVKKEDRVVENAKGERFIMHDDFCVIGTGNVYPNTDSIAYGANNKQDLSLLDRFAGCVYWIEKNPPKEQTIINNNLIWSLCDAMRTVIEERKYEAQVSLRLMLNMRDAYSQEMQRIGNGEPITKVNDGNTVKNKIQSFLSTFNPMQQDSIKEAINYNRLIENHQYRNNEPTDLINFN